VSELNSVFTESWNQRLTNFEAITIAWAWLEWKWNFSVSRWCSNCVYATVIPINL